MGALHEGHLCLVDIARTHGADRVVATIFVNPIQFGPDEDLDAYPRALEEDCSLLAERGVDLVFAPSADVMYPPGYQTFVDLEDLPGPLCGRNRPGHFRGVATVVTQLFNLVQPDLAIFGEKDFQQLQILKRMTRDLHLDIEIVGAPIVREADGLAMSSRNRHLSPDERQRAVGLSQSLALAKRTTLAGERSAKKLIAGMTQHLQAVGLIEYVVIVDEMTLEPVTTINGPVRALVAVHIGSVRLIDNCRLEPQSTTP
jgi:pantoate--beta-alanine ligase